jgi:predicted outer membrane protein
MRDRELAHCLVNGNRNEVEISKFALEKLQDAEVKQFAQKMITDHTKGMQTFARFAPGARATIPTSTTPDQPLNDRGTRTAPDRAAPDRPATADRDNPLDRDRPATPGRPLPTSTEVGVTAKAGLNWTQIGDELAAQCLASAKKELASKQGAEFEKCFLGLQVAGHMKMLDELQVFQRHAGDELRSEIGNAISTTQQHLQMAKKLMDEKKDTPDGARTTADRDAPRDSATPQPEERNP